MKKLILLFFFTLFFTLNFSTAHATPDCRGILETVGSVREDRPDLRQIFIAEYVALVFADEAQNQKWIDDALAYIANGDIHALIENSWMKKLNDTVLKNKDFVTALTNFHKKLFLEEIGKRLTSLKLKPYQDFKSTRLTLAGPVDPAQIRLLVESFAAANQSFYQNDRIKSILREEDRRESWFRMGIGQSEIQAALAARDARDYGGENGVSFFWDPAVKNRFDAKLKQIKELHETIVSRLRGTELLVRDHKWTTLRLDVFAAARQATEQTFFSVLKETFPLEPLDQEIADIIFHYTKIADEFSPSILIAKRELLTIHDAPYGAISLDFIGLGAENLRATARALIKSKNLDDAVRLTRVFEREVTQVFNQRKEWVRKSVTDYFEGQVNIRFSGDDCIITPQREVTMRDQLFLIQKLARLLSRPYFRMAVINAAGAAAPESSQLITHGESMEKALRQILRGKIGNESLNNISLQTFIPDTGRKRQVFLILAAKKTLRAEEVNAILTAFSTAVKVVEEQVRKQGLDIEYEPTETFAIYGKKSSE